MQNDFTSASLGEWLLAVDMERRQRNLLLQHIPFEEILAVIAKNAKLKSIRSEAYRRKVSHDHPDYHRVVLVLDAEPEAVALFHNSRCGYRAQYYHSVENGERANEFAIRALTPKIKELFADIKRLKW